MKTNIISLFIMLLLFFTACNTGLDSEYKIEGNLSGLPEGTVIQLIPVSHDREDPFAEVRIVDGKFSLTGSVEQPTAVILRVKDAFGRKLMMVENENIKIEGELTSSVNGDNINYDFTKVTVTGSPATIKYEELLSVRDEMNKLHAAYNTEHSEISALMSKARGEKNQEAIDSIAATDAYEALVQAERDFFSTVESTYGQVFFDNKDTYWGPLMMITLMVYFNEDNREYYEQFSPEAKESYYGQKVFNELYPVGAEGSQVAEFTITEDNVTFAELRKGKKYILLDFWASWCNPCLKEIPHLKELYSLYSDKGFEIVSISIDEKEEDWVSKSGEVQLPWPSYLDKDEIATLYNVRVIPTMYLVDENGTLVVGNIKGNDLDQKLAELLAE